MLTNPSAKPRIARAVTTRRTSAAATSAGVVRTPSSCTSGSHPADYVRRSPSARPEARMNVRPPRAWWRVLVALVAIAVVAVSVAAYAAKDKEPVRRVVYGTAEPQNSPGQSLFLQEVVIDPGAKLAQHFHEGTQLATIKAGVLTYSVVSGAVTIMHRDGTSATFDAPITVKLPAGDSIVENESLAHHPANMGTKTVVIEAASLLHDGAPLATPFGADAAGDTIKLETTLSSQSRTLYQTGPGNESTYEWNRLTGTSMLGGQPVSIEMLATVDYTKGSGPF